MELLRGILILCSAVFSVAALQSAFYTDNVFTGRTEIITKHAKSQRNSKRAIKEQLLNLLGLDHVPKHFHGGKHNSAPSYMLDLYRTLQNDVMLERDDVTELDSQWLARIKREILRRHLTLPGMEGNAEQADMIMSFVNAGE